MKPSARGTPSIVGYLHVLTYDEALPTWQSALARYEKRGWSPLAEFVNLMEPKYSSSPRPTAAQVVGIALLIIIGAAAIAGGFVWLASSPTAGQGARTLMTLSVVAIPALFAYLLPSVIAARRKSAALGWIFGLNILFGWTAIGWLAAFFWATAARR